MRIFIAGATGAIGRELLPLLAEHEVTGMTRSRPELVLELGAEPAVCDVYDRERVFEAVAAARPDVVVSLLTDLAERDFDANNRIRREGVRNLVDAAVSAGARRLLVESVDFELPPAGAAALAEMERIADESGLDVELLRFGLLWGPGTWYEEPPNDGAIHVRAAAEAVVAAL
ncbi:MAG TPA: NAD(P)H-binding protein [Gaiellaceae bacterium]|nr:NAD(P)H-binding protein [Gaiellaceae bacterium]